MIAHILLLPHPEHRERLLAPGAPVATRTTGDTRWSIGPRYYNDGPDDWPGFDFALVIARDGAVCPEGEGRACLVLFGDDGWFRAPFLDELIKQLWSLPPGVTLAEAVKTLREYLTPLGTLVLLDVDGKVSDV